MAGPLHNSHQSYDEEDDEQSQDDGHCLVYSCVIVIVIVVKEVVVLLRGGGARWNAAQQPLNEAAARDTSYTLVHQIVHNKLF